jgi:endonuclease/exonuclease/phosphatase family metal-dependent hydrolase
VPGARREPPGTSQRTLDALRGGGHLLVSHYGVPAAGIALAAGTACAVASRLHGHGWFWHGMLGAVAAGGLIAAAGAIGALVHGSEVPPSSPPHDTVTQHPGPSEHMRVMSFNVRYGIGPLGHTPRPSNLDAIAKTIQAQHPDVVLLQEVHDFRDDTAFTDQFASLASRLHATSGAWAPAHLGLSVAGGWDGNAVLTFNGFHIDDARAFHLTALHRGQTRVITDAEVATPQGRHVRVLTTHVGSAGSNLNAEDAMVGDIVGTPRQPTVLSGDWNATDDSPKGRFERRDFARHGLTDAFSATGTPIGSPARATFGGGVGGIDRIYTSAGVHVDEMRVDRSGPKTSDHRPVVADVTLTTPAPGASSHPLPPTVPPPYAPIAAPAVPPPALPAIVEVPELVPARAVELVPVACAAPTDAMLGTTWTSLMTPPLQSAVPGTSTAGNGSLASTVVLAPAW